jgi:hypothetical protein
MQRGQRRADALANIRSARYRGCRSYRGRRAAEVG